MSPSTSPLKSGSATVFDHTVPPIFSEIDRLLVRAANAERHDKPSRAASIQMEAARLYEGAGFHRAGQVQREFATRNLARIDHNQIDKLLARAAKAESHRALSRAARFQTEAARRYEELGLRDAAREQWKSAAKNLACAGLHLARVKMTLPGPLVWPLPSYSLQDMTLSRFISRANVRISKGEPRKALADFEEYILVHGKRRTLGILVAVDMIARVLQIGEW